VTWIRHLDTGRCWQMVFEV